MRCQRAVDEVSRLEEELSMQVRRIHKQGDEDIEQDRLAFRATYDKRLALKLEARLQEHKDLTARALEPEIQRLKAEHEREIREINYEFSRRQQLLREEIEAALVARIASARAEVDRNLEEKLKRVEHEAVQRKHLLQNELMESIESLRDELDRQLVIERMRLQKRFETTRKDSQDELARLQQESAKRVDAIRLQHREEKSALEKNFDQQV